MTPSLPFFPLLLKEIYAHLNQQNRKVLEKYKAEDQKPTTAPRDNDRGQPQAFLSANYRAWQSLSSIPSPHSRGPWGNCLASITYHLPFGVPRMLHSP